MSTVDPSAEAGAAATRQRMDFKLEIVVLPVADVDRAKEFYRLPGRVEGPDIATRAELLRETSVRHGRFEAATPPHNWWDWYAAYLSARETGASQDAADAAATPEPGVTRA